ncbi:MAG: T9SS type A sorting domain-containing protein [Bacteroidales bacterium]|nr:T9SS type A sorting domain-containing protein [Bacteroidales bacterium]
MRKSILLFIGLSANLIIFAQTPVANAGADTVFCGYSGNLNAIPSVGTGTWSTPASENVCFEDVNDPNTLVTSNIINTGNPSNPYFTLYWTETLGAETDRDTVKVIFARIPNSNINIIHPKCFGEPATIAAHEDSLQQYTWNFYTGAIDSTSINPLGGGFQNFVYWNSTDTLHRISLITTNYWGCQSAITLDTVYEPPIPIFDVTIISDTCMLGKGGVIFGDTLINNSFFWLDTVYGPPVGTPITTVYNLPTGEYNIKASYPTPNMIYYSYYLTTFNSANCIDTLDFEIPSIGNIETQIEVSAVVNLNNLTTENAQIILINLTEFEDAETYICEWHFDDGTTLHNCDAQIEHYYTEANCFQPYLIVMKSNMPECRDTAFITPCINVVNAGIDSCSNNLDFSIFPNPAKESFSILYNTTRPVKILVIDLNGKIAINIPNYQGEEINIKNLINGIYIVKIQSSDTTECKKLFVE